MTISIILGLALVFATYIVSASRKMHKERRKGFIDPYKLVYGDKIEFFDDENISRCEGRVAKNKKEDEKLYVIRLGKNKERLLIAYEDVIRLI